VILVSAADCVAIDADTGAAVAVALARIEVCAVAAAEDHGAIGVQALVGDDGSAVEVVLEAQAAPAFLAAASPAARRERQRPESQSGTQRQLNC